GRRADYADLVGRPIRILALNSLIRRLHFLLRTGRLACRIQFYNQSIWFRSSNGDCRWPKDVWKCKQAALVDRAAEGEIWRNIRDDCRTKGRVDFEVIVLATD